MGDLPQYATLTIGYTGGNFKLRRVSKHVFTPDRTVTVAVGLEGPVGFQTEDKGGSFTLDYYRETGTPEVDWHSLIGKTVTLTTQDEPGGKRIQYRPCMIEKVEATGESNGQQMGQVTGKYLKATPLN
jgi:hypothetical protein